MATNVKNKEFNLLVGHMATIFRDRVDPFRYDLKTLRRGSGVSEVPKSKMFGLVSDILTLNNFTSVYGDWIVAEVDGMDVQFNPLVPLEPQASVSETSLYAVQGSITKPSATDEVAPEGDLIADYLRRKALASKSSAKTEGVKSKAAKKRAKNKGKSTAKMAEFPINTNGADKSLD